MGICAVQDLIDRVAEIKQRWGNDLDPAAKAHIELVALYAGTRAMCDHHWPIQLFFVDARAPAAHNIELASPTSPTPS